MECRKDVVNSDTLDGVRRRFQQCRSLSPEQLDAKREAYRRNVAHENMWPKTVEYNPLNLPIAETKASKRLTRIIDIIHDDDDSTVRLRMGKKVREKFAQEAMTLVTQLMRLRGDITADNPLSRKEKRRISDAISAVVESTKGINHASSLDYIDAVTGLVSGAPLSPWHDIVTDEFVDLGTCEALFDHTVEEIVVDNPAITYTVNNYRSAAWEDRKRNILYHWYLDYLGNVNNDDASRGVPVMDSFITYAEYMICRSLIHEVGRIRYYAKEGNVARSSEAGWVFGGTLETLLATFYPGTEVDLDAVRKLAGDLNDEGVPRILATGDWRDVVYTMMDIDGIPSIVRQMRETYADVVRSENYQDGLDKAGMLPVGGPPPKAGKKQGRKPKSYTREEDLIDGVSVYFQRMLNCFNAGVDWNNIARGFHISVATILRRMQELGVNTSSADSTLFKSGKTGEGVSIDEEYDYDLYSVVVD